MKTLTIFAAFLLFPILANAQQVLLFDSFNGTSVNGSLWNEQYYNTGFTTSTITESGGNVTLTGRGTLGSVQGFNTPYNISGQFVESSPGATNEEEQFDVYFESNFSLFTADNPNYGVYTGVFVDFAASGNPDNLTIQQLSNNSSVFSGFLAETDYTLDDGTSYNFDINVNGPLISVYIDNNLVLSATSSTSSGDQIGLDDGVFAGDATSVNDFEVTSVPEPGMYGVIFGLVGLAMMGCRKYKFRM